jgi:DNA-binding Xre family transcriptional regulator
MHEFRFIKDLKKAIINHLRPGLPAARSVRDFEREIGESHGNLQRFLDGKRGISVQTINRICEILNLELRPPQES